MDLDYWTQYQPGFKFSRHPVGSREFFDEVTAHRYALEPAILEMARFAERGGLDVLDAGCGIATDGLQFASHGARYTGMDRSETALAVARPRFADAGMPAEFVHGSLTDLPFAPRSFDLVYSNGVIHHIPETQRVVDEFSRVLRPGGQAVVMVYHRASLNYYVSILLIRRLLALAVMLPRAVETLSRITGEPASVIEGHRGLLRQHGLRYLRDKELFLSNNTDGPGNPLSKVYTAMEAKAMFERAGFRNVETQVRFLNLRVFPGGARLAATRLAQRLEVRFGWHLWITATK
jgi:SAM-dependent methyltransferase